MTELCGRTNGNNEWPVVQGLKLDNPALKSMTGGGFKSELIPISAVGMNQIKVQQMLDRVGYKYAPHLPATAA